MIDHRWRARAGEALDVATACTALVESVIDGSPDRELATQLRDRLRSL